MWPHSNRKKDEVTPVGSRDRKKKDRLHHVLTNRKKCSRAIPGVLNSTYKGSLSHVKQHSQNPIRSKQQCTVCSLHLFRFPLPKNLRCFCWLVHIIAIARTCESIWRKWELGNPNGAPQLGRINTYTAHTLLFFQLRSTLSNRPNWGSPFGVFSLACAIQSDPIGLTAQLRFPNWGYDPIGEPQLGRIS